MKLVELFVPSDREDVLDDRNVDYVRVPTTDERTGTLVHFPLPEEGVDEILTDPRNLGIPDDCYTVVAGADTVTSEHFERLRERYAEQEQDESVPSEELRDRAAELNPSWGTFTGTALLSAVVVAAGLLRNSAAAVAGAMVIAPYFGTALSVRSAPSARTATCFSTVSNTRSSGSRSRVPALLSSASSLAGFRSFRRLFY